MKIKIESGSLKSAETVLRIEGVPQSSIIEPIIGLEIEIITYEKRFIFEMKDVLNSKLFLIDDKNTVFFPGQNRKDWISSVKEIKAT